MPYPPQMNAPVVILAAPPSSPQLAAPPGDSVKIYSNPVRMEEPASVLALPAERSPALSSLSSANSLPAPAPAQPMYLIALRNETVATAIAYWTDGTQLKYITPDRKQKQTALKEVDVSLTVRLNEERGVTVSAAQLSR